MLSKTTPGPWLPAFYSPQQATAFGGYPGWFVRWEGMDGPLSVSKKVCDVTDGTYIDLPTAQANAKLLALAPDHALLLAAMARFRSVMYGMKQTIWVLKDEYAGSSTRLEKMYDKFPYETDPFGCPILTDELRVALKAAIGLEVK